MRSLKKQPCFSWWRWRAAQVQTAGGRTPSTTKSTPAGVGSILKFDGTKHDRFFFSTGFQFPEGLVRDTLGNFYFVDEFNDKLMKVGPAGGVATAIATISDLAPYDIAI